MGAIGEGNLVDFVPRVSYPREVAGAIRMSRHVTTCTWYDVPHLSADAIEEMLAGYPPAQREARSKGIPSLGSGAIYPVPEEEIIIRDFPIPDLWPRAYGLDVGWNRTAAIWGARDPQSGVIYLYSEHYMSQVEPVIHAKAIQGRGEWIPGVIDPASRGRSQRDGQQLIQNYIDLGLKVSPAENAVEAGLQQVWNLLVSGKLKAFKSLGFWLEEYRKYQRDEKGHVKKQNDHLMDATRYLIVSGRDEMRTKPEEIPASKDYYYAGTSNGWMS